MAAEDGVMAIYTARIKYIDEREITVEAENDEEALAKYEAGEWESEDTVDFYSLEETRKLTKQ